MSDERDERSTLCVVNRRFEVCGFVELMALRLYSFYSHTALMILHYLQAGYNATRYILERQSMQCALKFPRGRL